MQLSDATAHYKMMSSVTEKVSPEEENKKEENRKNELEHLKNSKKNTEKSNEPGVSGIAVDEGILDDDSDSVTVVVRSGKKRKLDSSESEGYDSDSDTQTTPQKNIRCHKRLKKEQYEYFKQHGFTDELITIILDEGLDKIDIENCVLLYNHQNNEHVPLPILSRQKDIYRRSGGEKDKNPNSKKGNEGDKNDKSRSGNKDDGKKEKDKGGKGGGSRDNGKKKDGNDEGAESSTSGKKGKGSKKDESTSKKK